MEQRISSFKDFYPFYLNEHRNGTCRTLHFVGSSIVLALLRWKLCWFMPLAGYGCAWIGHFVFEKNRPATFKYPLYSFIGDWVMIKDIVIGRVPMFGQLPVQ